MMKKISLIITATILSISISAQDPHWNTDGNTGTDPNDDFVGTTDDADLPHSRASISAAVLV